MVTFTAKPANYAETPPPGAVILASYARAVEAAFESLGPGQLELFRETTDPHPVEVVEGVLVRDQIPAPATRGSGSRRAGSRGLAQSPFQRCAQARSSRIAGRRALPFSVSA